MESARLPRAYLIFLAVALVQFGLIVLVTHTSVTAGAVLYALLLWRLARGGSVAWFLLLGWSGFASLTALSVIGNGSGVLWGNVAVMVIPGAIMVSLLLSAPMRVTLDSLVHIPPTEVLEA